MAYHSDFWIAVATAAPVLALGHAYAVEAGLREGNAFSKLMALETIRASDRNSVTWRRSGSMIARSLRTPPFWLYCFAVVIIIQCGFAFWDSLRSLATESDKAGTTSESIRLVVILGTLLLQASVADVSRNWFERASERASKELNDLKRATYQRGQAKAEAEIAELRTKLQEQIKRYQSQPGAVAWELYGDHYENVLDAEPNTP